MESTIKLLPNEVDELLSVLQTRFEKNTNRHIGLIWSEVKDRLMNQPQKLVSVYEMEKTGGEPDVVGVDKESKEFIFVDCSPESPSGRRSLCFDRAGLDSRKEFKPENNAVDMAAEMGIELLSEQEYIELQMLGQFDLKTSSWVKTPENIRKLGGALFCDRRYDAVFVYHNGAQSYYASRGFRGSVRI